MTARDVVYGRRGGRWATKPSSKEPAAGGPSKVGGHAHCRICGTAFYYQAKPGDPPPPPPTNCGELHCRALDTWGPDEWAGAARMAEARLAADIPLSDLDDEALHRATRKTS